MLPQLHCDKVITIDQKKRIEARQLESEGVQFFLDDVLLLSLRLDMTNIYSSFVGVLKKSGDPIQCEMAKKIGKYMYEFAWLLSHNHIPSVIVT